jgi:hypothetical protein
VQEPYGHTLGYGLTMVAALSELAPVLHVNTFQQERGDSFSCGIWATWNKAILDWYIELGVRVTMRDIQNPPPAPADLMLRSRSSRLAICSTTLSPQLVQEALLRQDVPQMTSCLDEWITERQSIVRALLPPAPDKQHKGKRSAPVLSPSSAKRLRRSKAPASAKRPTPKLAEPKADWHVP